MNKPSLKPSTADGSIFQSLQAAIIHVDEAIGQQSIPFAAARGIVYSLIEMLGAMMGTPNLPEHLLSGYEGLLEAANELEAKIHQLKEPPSLN